MTIEPRARKAQKGPKARIHVASEKRYACWPMVKRADYRAQVSAFGF